MYTTQLKNKLELISFVHLVVLIILHKTTKLNDKNNSKGLNYITCKYYAN